MIEAAPETKQIEAPAGETNSFESLLQRIDTLLPDVSLAEITAIVSAFNKGIQRRDMCTHLKWGGAKYTSIVKPVLDAYEQLQQTASWKHTEC